ncbi:hypothetical protein E8E14_001152 [Neopestalotiopsis sp. 37M]|nr:hypothetical protein E8E14_001152 [Neopestalotiopsis sp. 37M]
MWDRFRPLKDGLSASQSSDRKKLNVQNEWQTPRAPSPYGYSIKIQGGPAPPRPPRDFEHSSPLQTSAPAVQAVRHNPPPRTGLEPYRNSEYGRPVSSIYSQPSPAAATFAAEQLRGDVVYSDPNEISPPSSPEDLAPRNGTHSYGGGDVSPIEDTENRLYIMNNPPAEPSAHQGRSNIPQMRRERRKNSTGAMFQPTNSPERPKQYRPHGKDVRWDPQTGEPTVGEKGRPSQIDPHNYVQRLATANAPTGAPQRPGQQPINPFGVRLKPAQQRARPNPPPEQIPRSNPQAEQASRPEWRGGSGRTALVDPVADNHSVAPLHIPRRSSKRTPRDPGVISPVSPGGSETTSPPPMRTAPEKLDESRPKAMNVRITTTPSSQQQKSRVDASSYPSPPLSDDQSAPVKTAQAPRSQQPAPTPTQSQEKQALLQANQKAIRRKPAGGSTHTLNLSVSSSVYSQVDNHSPAVPPVDDRFQLPSRSAGNTGSTPTSSANSQTSTVVPPTRPTPTRQQSESPKPVAGDSVLDRKRPVVKGYEDSIRSQPSPEPIKINMGSPYYTTTPEPKPTGARPMQYSNNVALSILSMNTTGSGDKDLPMVPPELSARDRVTFLNAQIEALGNRRININHAIKQMTELMPTDNVLASDAVIRKREAEKRKVENLRAELADVQREEYELGLKLHRAYKRLDRDAEYEPTTLWVRRVTG